MNYIKSSPIDVNIVELSDVVACKETSSGVSRSGGGGYYFCCSFYFFFYDVGVSTFGPYLSMLLMYSSSFIPRRYFYLK